MKTIIKTVCLIATLFWLSGCNRGKEAPNAPLADTAHAEIPKEVAVAIEKEFPGALPYRMAIDSLLHHLTRFGITPNEVLWGQSTCVDDITNTKNKLASRDVKGPFTFGGLAGIPFTGITGVDAFAHHVPEDGTALLFVGPHIGYNVVEGWGKIMRHGQHHSSTCCGALYAALNKLQKNEIKPSSPTENDYQEQVIEQLALAHEKEITTATNPLLKLTRITMDEAEARMTKYVQHANERHFPYAVIVIGVIINTDLQYEDYLWLKRIAVKDIKKNVFIEEL